MNILHITTFLQGGAGRVIKDIAFHQKDNDNNVYILASKMHEPGYCNYEEYINEFNKKNIPVFLIDSTFKRDIYLNLNVANELKNIIKEKDIDIIHAHAAVPAMVGLVGRAGLNKRYIPVIQTMHGWGTNKKTEHENMDVTIMNSLDKVITVSKSDEKLMISKGVSSSKVITIYNGIEEKNDIELNEDKVIKELKIKKQEGYKIIGCIGTVCKRKNQQLLIEVLKDIDDEQKIFCAFIGEGNMLETLKHETEKYALEKHIKFYEYRNNASQYLKYFDYFVLPSLSEGFSVSILEAFRDNVPVICSDIGTFKEVIKDDITGYLFKNNNKISLKETILKVMNKNDTEITIINENAYKNFEKHFVTDKMFFKYDHIYNEYILKNINKKQYSKLININ